MTRIFLLISLVFGCVSRRHNRRGMVSWAFRWSAVSAYQTWGWLCCLLRKHIAEKPAGSRKGVRTQTHNLTGRREIPISPPNPSTEKKASLGYVGEIFCIWIMRPYKQWHSGGRTKTARLAQYSKKTAVAMKAANKTWSPPPKRPLSRWSQPPRIVMELSTEKKRKRLRIPSAHASYRLPGTSKKIPTTVFLVIQLFFITSLL